MPSAADAATAAMARYGLASAPGRRHSRRQSSGWSLRTIARTAHERFSTPQLALTGANHPGTRRLYELMVGLRSREAAGRCSSTPAIAERSAAGSVLTSPPRNALVPSLQHERWTWPLEPSSPGAVLARKLARKPIVAARSLTAIFVRAASSAARSAGLAPRLSSSRPGPASV